MCPTGDTNTNGRDHSQCCWMQRVGRVVHLCLIKSRISWVHTRKPQILRTQTITHTGESNKMGHTDLRGLISPSYTHTKFKKVEYSLFFIPLSLSLPYLNTSFSVLVSVQLNSKSCKKPRTTDHTNQRRQRVKTTHPATTTATGTVSPAATVLGGRGLLVVQD